MNESKSAAVSSSMLNRLMAVRVNENLSNLQYLHSIAFNARAE